MVGADHARPWIDFRQSNIRLHAFIQKDMTRNPFLELHA